MKEALLESLCCPVCKGSLECEAKTTNTDQQVLSGELSCRKCRMVFRIEKAIPWLYVEDNFAKDILSPHKFSDLIITPERIATETAKKLLKKPTRLLLKGKLSYLCILGWLFLILSGILICLKILGEGLLLGSFLQSAAVPFASLAILLFIGDFIMYRMIGRALHREQWQRLAELYQGKRLSEYDSRLQVKDKHDDDNDETLPHPKAKEIALLLDNFEIWQRKGINIGCGGEIHQSVTKPFFNRGCNMLGIDIHEDYLLQYRKKFNADAVLSNALFLPFKNEAFDLALLADILEHLHNPFLGLCEVSRVLKGDGLIIVCTNYRSRCNFDCANPLVFIERVASLYFNGVLGPRVILSSYQALEFYHSEFSKPELTALLKSTGFEIVSFYTYFHKSRWLTKLFRKLPILRFMGTSIVIIGRKRMSSSD